jgi:glycosyltransferase involved in cell wall biosynthesis
VKILSWQGVGMMKDETGRNLRVLQVIDHLQIGGAQRLLDVFRLAGGQDRKTEILSFGSSKDPLHLRLSKDEVTIHVLPDCRLWRPRTYLDLVREIRRLRPDILHLHLTYATILGGFAGRLAGCPSVATIHNTHTVQDQGLRGKVLRFLETMAVRLFVRRVIFVGKITEAANRHRFGGVPTVTIDNVVEPSDPALLERRPEMRRSLGVGADEVVILSTGRLHPTKNIANLLEAFARVLRAYPNARLWICGDGPLAGTLAEQAKRLELDGAVTFLGGRDDVPVLLHAADVFALSSDAEGLPLALLEAMSAGLPVVATAVGSVPEYVDEASGLIVPPKDIDALAQALMTMVAGADQRASAGAAARARSAAFTDVVTWRAALEAEYAKALFSGGS